ncbi:uncharacterized protein V6R79_026462 [Siganus canaliculatus]
MVTVAWFLFFGGLLVGCSAMEVPCRVTPDGSKTTYSIDSAPGDCYEYSFTNATHVLAHAADYDPELVMISNMSTLVTSQCMESITYHCSCFSQGEVHVITSNCSMSSTVVLARLVFTFIIIRDIYGEILKREWRRERAAGYNVTT